MAAQDQVGTGFGPSLECGFGAAQSVVLVLGPQNCSRLVRYDDSQLPCPRAGELRRHASDLRR